MFRTRPTPKPPLNVCLVAAVVVLCAACGPSLTRIDAATAGAHRAIVSAHLLAGDHATGEAVGRATDRVRGAVSYAVLATDPDDPAFRRRAFVDLVDAQDFATAALLLHFWEPDLEDFEEAQALANLSIAQGRFEAARELSWNLAERFPDRRGESIRLFYSAHRADPDIFSRTPRALEPAVDLDELDPFRGSSSIIMRARLHGDTFAAFKPHQNVRHQRYRAEVASWRLCLIIFCEPYVPRTDEVRVHESDLRPLLGMDEDEELSFPAPSRRELIWFEDPFGFRWLHGVMKAWVPGIQRFPVEHRGVWEGLVSIGESEDSLRQTTIAEAVEGFRGRLRGDPDRIVRASPSGVTGFDLAHQLSDLHVLDFLGNNYDRYQPEVYLGMNLHWAEGRLVSIDNGATFALPEEHDDRSAWRRLQRVELFSRKTIRALQWMDTDAAYELLFPPTPHYTDEAERWAAFVDRRERLLGYVDSLIEAHGEDAVFIFP